MMSGVLLFLKIIALLDEQSIRTAVRQASIYQNLGPFDPSRLFSDVTRATQLPGRAVLSDWANTILWSRPPIFTTATKLIIDLLSVSFVTCVAFGQATATLVSQQMGEKNFDSAEAYGWDSVKIGMLFFGSIGLLAIIFPGAFLDLLSDDPAVIQTAIPGLRIMASLEMFVAMALILTQALFGAGNPMFVMYTELILHAVCLVPLTYALAVWLGLGFIGVWLAASIYIILLAVIMAWKFWEGSWKDIDV
jgi:Na+-driven multidrug efflux pump